MSPSFSLRLRQSVSVSVSLSLSQTQSQSVSVVQHLEGPGDLNGQLGIFIGESGGCFDEEGVDLAPGGRDGGVNADAGRDDDVVKEFLYTHG